MAAGATHASSPREIAFECSVPLLTNRWLCGVCYPDIHEAGDHFVVIGRVVAWLPESTACFSTGGMAQRTSRESTLTYEEGCTQGRVLHALSSVALGRPGQILVTPWWVFGDPA